MNCALNQQFYFKTFLIALLSFLLLFSISCGKTPAEPEVVEVSEDFTESVPTATGNPATDLTNAYYRGTLSLTSHSANATSGVTKEEVENDILSQGDMILYLNITNNNLILSELYRRDIDESGLTDEQVQNNLEMNLYGGYPLQVLKSDSKYSVSDAFGSISNYGHIGKFYIEFTISGDNMSITYIDALSRDSVVDGVNYKYSYKTTYEGTLTNYTPTSSGS